MLPAVTLTAALRRTLRARSSPVPLYLYQSPVRLVRPGSIGRYLFCTWPSVPPEDSSSKGRVWSLRLPSRRPRAVSKTLWGIIKGLRIQYIGRPGVSGTDEQPKGMPKAAYYGVARGRQPGVYTTWAETEAQVKGYPGAVQKKFTSEQDARAFIASNGATPARTTPSTTASSFAGPSSKPYTRPVGRPGPIKPVKPQAPVSDLPPIYRHKRSDSPTTQAQAQDLPDQLGELSSQGYTFSKGPKHHLVVWTDGSALGNGKVGSRAGAGVFWGSTGEAASRNHSERVQGLPQTNNRGELLAIIRALEACPSTEIPLEIRCDSQYSISCLTTWLPKWLRTNFRTSGKSFNRNGGELANNEPKQVSNVDMIKHLLVLLGRRGPLGPVKFKWVNAHTGVEGNEAADRLAKMGAMMPEPTKPIEWLDPDHEPVKAPSIDPTTISVDIDEG